MGIKDLTVFLVKYSDWHQIHNLISLKKQKKAIDDKYISL